MGKSHLIFLHGALGCKQHWERFLPAFEKHYVVHNLNFPNHGDSKEKLTDFSYQTFTWWLKTYIVKNNITDFSIIGYSMGGYIALNLIHEGISGFNLLITLATKLNWDKEIAKAECDKLTIENLQPIQNKLQNEHVNNWPKLIEVTKEVLLSIGETPIKKKQFLYNKMPVMMLSGSKDKMVTQDEITTFAENTPNFYQVTIENQPHLLERMDINILNDTLLHLIGNTHEISY